MSGVHTPLHLIVLAGGSGSRAGSGDATPKQFRSTGRGLLGRVALDTFVTGQGDDTYRLASVTVTVPAPWYDEMTADFATTSAPVRVVPGGPTRVASTWCACRGLVETAVPAPDDLVAVHDAARPFATAQLLARLAAAAAVHGSAVPGLPVVDTIVQDTGDGARYLQRGTLLGVQTPQVFRWDIFHAAHRWADETGTDFSDDGGLLSARGHNPAVVPGDPANWKVTTGDDWERARALLTPGS